MSRDPDLIVSDFEYLDLNSNVNWLNVSINRHANIMEYSVGD